MLLPRRIACSAHPLASVPAAAPRKGLVDTTGWQGWSSRLGTAHSRVPSLQPPCVLFVLSPPHLRSCKFGSEPHRVRAWVDKHRSGPSWLGPIPCIVLALDLLPNCSCVCVHRFIP